jgi:hypothetical protein
LKPRPFKATGLFESLDRGGFVVFYIENSVELGDLKQVVHLFGEVQQFEFATLILGSGEGADQLADSGAVDIVDLAEVQDNLLITFGEQVSNGVAQSDAAFAEGDAAAAVHNGDSVYLPCAKFHAH